MKKLTASLGVLLIFSATLFGQYGRHHNERHNNDKQENNRNSRYDNNDSHEANRNSRYGNNNRKDKHFKGNNRNRGNSNNVNTYQRQARMKIQEGVSRGLITRREERKLMVDFNKIARKENKYLRNGRLSRKENNDLKRDLMNLNRKIERESRDLQRNRRRRF